MKKQKKMKVLTIQWCNENHFAPVTNEKILLISRNRSKLYRLCDEFANDISLVSKFTSFDTSIIKDHHVVSYSVETVQEI